MTLAALEATLRHYQRDEAESTIPIWRMIAQRPEKLASRANRWATNLQAQGIAAHVQRGESTVGGGSLPGETLPTSLLALDAKLSAPTFRTGAATAPTQYPNYCSHPTRYAATRPTNCVGRAGHSGDGGTGGRSWARVGRRRSSFNKLLSPFRQVARFDSRAAG